MKTNRFIILFIIGISIASCNTPYKVVTHIQSDGSVVREYYAYADSAFVAGDYTRNPFPVSLDSGWTITRVDSFPQKPLNKANFTLRQAKQKDYMLKASRTFTSIERLGETPIIWEDARPLLTPKDTMKKQFKWFYTYYSFEGVYPSLAHHIPVPIDSFLNKEEQKIWLKGDIDTFKEMNGIELSELLRDIEPKFWEWYHRCQYEISYGIVYKQAKKMPKNKYLAQLPTLKDSLFSFSYDSREIAAYIKPYDIAELLDKHFDTDYFSKLQVEYSHEFNNQFDERFKVVEVFGYLIDYQLSMPGKVISTNAIAQDKDLLIWKINAYRILADEYTIQAVSRKSNLWAFAITGFLIVFSISCFRKARRMRK